MKHTQARFTYFLIISLLFSLPLCRDVYAAFDSIGVGARAISMGKSFVAVADDANTVWWNPAGVVSITRPELTSQYSDLFLLGLVRYTTLSFAANNVAGGGIGAGFSHLSASDKEYVTPISYSEDIFTICYGRRILDLETFVLDCGLSCKYYQARSTKKGTGCGFDVGALAGLGHRLKFGLAWQDFNQPTIHWIKDAPRAPQYREKIMPDLRVGGALLITDWLLVTCEFRQPGPDSEFHIGGELRLRGIISLRSGGYLKDKKWIYGGGFGISWQNLRLDVAMLSHFELSTTPFVSLSFEF